MKISKKLIMYVYSAIFFIVVIVLFISFMFLYNNFFNSSTIYNEIILLKQKTASETVNIRKFNEVITKINEKVKTKDSPITRDLFK